MAVLANNRVLTQAAGSSCTHLASYIPVVIQHRDYRRASCDLEQPTSTKQRQHKSYPRQGLCKVLPSPAQPPAFGCRPLPTAEVLGRGGCTFPSTELGAKGPEFLAATCCPLPAGQGPAPLPSTRHQRPQRLACRPRDTRTGTFLPNPPGHMLRKCI